MAPPAEIGPPSDPTTSEAEVLALELAFLDAWNRGDAAGAAAFYAEDGVRVGAFGDVQRGRAEIEAAYATLWSGPMRGAGAEVAPVARWIAAGVVLVQGPIAIRLPDGSVMNGWAADLWRRSEGGWRLVEAHPKLFPAR